MTNILDLEDKIRDLINSARKQKILLRDKSEWNKLCSSLDIIGDTELAIDEYLKAENIETTGLKYLYVFGIMQILFVQQDGVKNLCESLNMEFCEDDDLKEIRRIRNDSIGHPTMRYNGKNKFYNFIIRPYLGHRNFSLMTVYPEKIQDTKFRHFSIPDIVLKQQNSLRNILLKVIQQLKEEDMEHKKQFKDEKLTSCFHPTLRYHFEKVNESIWSSIPLVMGKISFNVIIGSLKDFQNSLVKREILDAYDSIKYILGLLDYPIKRLTIFFEDSKEIQPNDAYIYSFFIEKQLDELIKISKELDEYYKVE